MSFSQVVLNEKPAGAGTRVRAIIHRNAGKESFEDLWKRTPGGVFLPKRPGELDVVTRNKMLQRGLSYMLLCDIYGHNSVGTGDKTDPDISFGEARAVFEWFMVFADAATKPADALVEWGESNGEFDPKIPDGVQPHTVGEGKRGVDANVTTDLDGLKNQVVAWQGDPFPPTGVYRYLEYVMYARATQSMAKAIGLITVDAVPADGETFTLDDGTPTWWAHAPVVFEFDTDDSITLGRVRVDVSGLAPGATDAASRNAVKDAIIAAVNAIGEDLDISAADFPATTGKLVLTHEGGGTVGNTTITDGTSGDLTVVSFTGGTGAEGEDVSTGNQQIDNLPIKAMGFAYNFDCGASEASSQLGLRAIFGFAATAQGVRDRGYVHEIINYSTGVLTAMTKYTGATVVSGDGYVTYSPTGGDAGGELAEVEEADFSNAPVITIGTEEIEISSAEWDLPATRGFRAGVHERKWIRLSGGTDAGDWKIQKVTGPRKVIVFGNLTTDDSTGAKLITKYVGSQGFDGRVENEGLTEAAVQGAYSSDPNGTIMLGEKWSSEDEAGPHILGRVWASSKTIRGVRIVAPAGMSKDFVPNKFKIQYLNPAGSKRPSFDAPNQGDWLDVPGQDYSGSGADQAAFLYAAGAYGVEYVFAATVATQGIRLSTISSDGLTNRVEIAEVLIYEDVAGVALTSEVLKVSLNAGGTWKYFNIPDVVAATALDVQDLVDALNVIILGYGYEAIRSEFGYLWLRRTVAGDNSTLHIDSEANGSTVNTDIGLPVGGTNRVGETQVVLKRPVDAATFIIRFQLSGDHLQL